MSGALPVVDGERLPEAWRLLLQPGVEVSLGGRQVRRLPRFFYAVESWEAAKAFKLTAHFTLAELMTVDCREAPLLLRSFPHYVPCAVSVLARYLEEFRSRAEAPVLVAVNGGYRSPAHGLARPGSLHLWGTAANLYRIGEHWLDQEKTIERYGRIAAGIGQEVSVRPFGHGPGQVHDHLHLDLGFLQVEPLGPLR